MGKMKIMAAPAVIFQPVSGDYLITSRLYNTYEDARSSSAYDATPGRPGSYYWIFYDWPVRIVNGAWRYEAEDFYHLDFEERMKVKPYGSCNTSRKAP